MGNECAVCGEPIDGLSTIHAGLGVLCCSKNCAAKYAAEALSIEELAEYAVDGCFEEVAPYEIGIVEGTYER